MAGHKPVSVDELYTEITRALSIEVQEIEESVDIAADMATKELLFAIREDSPVGKTKEYKKGWTRKKFKGSYVVYNKSKPYLTHLLELGHAKRNGGRVEGKPHIKPNEEIAIRDFEDTCIAIVSDGLRLKKSDINQYTDR